MFNKDSKPNVAALIEENSKLKERINTYRAKIRPLSDFIDINNE